MVFGAKDILINVKGDNKDFNTAMTSSDASMKKFATTASQTAGSVSTSMGVIQTSSIGATAGVTSLGVASAASVVGVASLSASQGLFALTSTASTVAAYKAIYASNQSTLANWAQAMSRDKLTLSQKIGVLLTKSGIIAKKGLAVATTAASVAVKGLTAAYAALKVVALPVILAIGVMVGTTVKYTNELIKVSAQTGVAASELSAYGYAAKQANIEFNDLTESMKDLNDRVYDAHSGNTALMETFNSLGISIYDTSGDIKNSKTLFEEVGTAVGNIEDPVRKTNVAMELMADNGYKLIPIFNDMQTFIDDTDFAKIHGIAMTDDEIKRMEEFNKKLSNFKEFVIDVSRDITVTLIPTLTILLHALHNIMATAKAMWAVLDGDTETTFAGTMEEANEAWNKMLRTQEDVSQEFRVQKDLIDEQLSGLSEAEKFKGRGGWISGEGEWVTARQMGISGAEKIGEDTVTETLKTTEEIAREESRKTDTLISLLQEIRDKDYNINVSSGGSGFGYSPEDRSSGVI